MRAVTWNIQRGRRNPDGPPAIERVAAAIQGLEPDVCALQEMDRHRRRSGGADQPSLLADALDGQLAWAPTLSGTDGEYGIGLVVRGEILDTEVVPLSGTREPRVALIVKARIHRRPWTLACTHLSRRMSFAQGQLVTVLDAMAAHPVPRVLLGDLNLVPGEVLPWSTPEGYQLLTGPPTHSTRRARVTRRIDHILLAGTAAEAAAVVQFDVSDHCAVRADLR